MNGLFYTILEMSISASILVLVVLLLRLILKKAPKWVSVLLWALVAIRLICPFAIESPFSLMPNMDYLVVREATSYADAGLGDSPDDIPEYVIGGNQFGDEATAQPAPIDTVTQDNQGVNIELILNLIWLSGIAVMLIYMIVSCICVYRRIQKSTQFRDNIYTSNAVTSPFVFGIVKPRIYLPESMDAVSMSYVIAHEEAHVRRRDHWWKPLGFILLAVHWFNPIIWLAYILLCRDIEMACDERVIRDMGERERVDYSEALLDCSVDRRMITACPLAFGENNVKERIRTVLNYKKPAFWIVILAVIACVAAAICFLTNPQSDTVNTIHNVILYDTETKQEMYLYEYEKNKGVSVIKSAQIDLDNDRVYEEVLWLMRGSNEHYGFLIVNFANDKAYAHELPYSAFMDLKDDGTFSFASSVSDHGVGRITFTGDTYTINKIAYSESDPDTQIITYYIGGETVSKQDFDSYLDAQSKKQNVRLNGWVDAYAIPDTEPAEENNMKNDNPPTVETGYPSGEIQIAQIVYSGRIYYYSATGFDNPLPDKFEYVGNITGIDNINGPSKNFHGARVEIGQEVYANEKNSDAIYLKYKNGYAKFEVIKPTNNTLKSGFENARIKIKHINSNGQLVNVTLGINLPKEWKIQYDYQSYEMIPFAEYADIKNGSDCVGGIGFLTYDLPADQADIPEAIFNQIAMGSMTFWNIRQHFDLVTAEDSPYSTALTSVLYSSKAFQDGKERSNSAIVSYNPEYKMYIALQLTDGTKDRTILSEEELRYVAESIEWIDVEFSDTGADASSQSELFKKTVDFLSKEFHDVYDPYYQILNLAIFDWTENGNEATFRYTVTHQYWNRDPDTVDYIKAAKDDPERYEMMCKDYLVAKVSNFYFKVVLNGDEIELYSNESPTGIEWKPRKIADYLPNS